MQSSNPCNLITPTGESVALTAGSGNTFTGTATFGRDSESAGGEVGAILRFEAVDSFGLPLIEEFGIALEPDRAPAIEIVSPSGSAILPPGELPKIEFRISDEYGLTEVSVEEVTTGTDGKPVGTPAKRWASPGAAFL